MNSLDDRVLLHLDDGRRVPVDPNEIYCLSVDDGNTLVRTRRAVPLIDVRQLSEIMEHFENHGFVQVHRSWAVNLRKIRNKCQAREYRDNPAGHQKSKIIA